MLVRITADPLDDQEARRHVDGPGFGAIILFHGIVRNRHEGRTVEAVEYSAYTDMATRELLAVAKDVRGRHAVGEIAVLHRLGRLAVGEVSLVVAVSAAHRKPAFDAALDLIDTLKARVPIWKKEIGPSGETWQDGVLPDAGGPAARTKPRGIDE